MRKTCRPRNTLARKTGVRGITVEEDLSPEEYPSRKTVEEDLAQIRDEAPPEEDPPRKGVVRGIPSGVRGIPFEEDLAQ